MNTSTRTRVAAGLVLATVVTATIAATTTAAGNAAGVDAQDPRATAKIGWKPAWHSEFGTPEDQWPADWRKVGNTGYGDWTTLDRLVVAPGKSQARNLDRNVTQDGGKLVISTRRVCAKDAPTSPEDFAWLAGSKASVQPCSGGRKEPVYTSGRVQIEHARSAGANVRIDYRATLPTKPATGTRQALWANNVGHSYCDQAGTENDRVTSLGEMDAVEWYGNKPGRSYSTTHMSCSGSGADPWQTLRRQHQDPIQPGSTHTWSIRKTGTSVEYYLDGKRVEQNAGKRPDTCDAGPFKLPDVDPTTGDPTCAAIMTSPWRVILQGEVFGGKFDAGKRQSGPNDQAAFPVQKLKIDWVRVYTR